MSAAIACYRMGSTNPALLCFHVRACVRACVASLQVRDVSGMTTSARRLVQNMNRREVQQRCMMYGIGLILVVGVIIAVYYVMK